MLNYTITEEEVNALTSARMQLNMLAVLMTTRDAESNIDGPGLAEFLDAQQRALLRLETVIEDRGFRTDAPAASIDQPSATSAISTEIIVDALRAASGEQLLHARLLEIGEAFIAAQANVEANAVLFPAFVQAMERRGLVWSVTMGKDGPAPQFAPVDSSSRAKAAPRKREKLARHAAA
ncbi:hypothetical protein [Variovorax sp.]|uniref:hypothetical protein n=1 Tax=Variovorax sp. TaxID=1871043 RepID=UPI003BAA2817